MTKFCYLFIKRGQFKSNRKNSLELNFEILKNDQINHIILTTWSNRGGNLVIDVTFEVPRVDESLLVDYKIAINVVAQLEGSE